MAEQKESSVLFSLKELMNLEEDRIKQEEDEKARAEQAVVDARLAEERRLREEEEARQQAADNARRAEEQRQREEAARLEAIRQGEVEKAKADAENQARLAAMRQQQEHEQKLTAINQDKKKKQLTFAIGGVVALLVLVGVGAGIAINQSNAKTQAALEEMRARENEVAALQASMTQQKAEAARIDEQLKSTTDVATRLQLEKQKQENEKRQKEIAANEAAAAAAAARAKANSGSKGSSASAPKGSCPPGDPLCTN